MRAILEILDGGTKGARIEVGTPPCQVGRAADCRVRLDPHKDAQASGHHCQIELRGGAFWVVDLKSANGTFVNGARISEYTLNSGDVLTFGVGGPSARFLVEAERPAPPPGPADYPRTVVGRPEAQGGTVVVPLPRTFSGPTVRLTIQSAGTPDVRTFHVPVIRMGRHPSNDLVFDRSTAVSSNHAKISLLDGAWTLVDLESTNGTWIRDAAEPRQVTRHGLRSGDSFELGAGGPVITFELEAAPGFAALQSAPGLAAAQAATAAVGTVVLSAPRILEIADRDQVQTGRIPLTQGPLTFGRDATCNIQLTEGQVSARHATVFQQGQTWFVEDLGSRNGTYVNGRAVSRQPLAPGDVILIGGRRFEFHPPVIEMYDFERRAALQTYNLTRVASGKVILDDVSLTIGLGEFVALVGPSGSGKSTLLKALNGYRFADKGSVQIGGSDLYREFASVKQAIGYVPQDDALHMTLTVNQTMDFVARLRLPSDFTPAERRTRIDSVLSQLELIDHREKRIHMLSGGQRKRVSIGVELLTDPKVLFLDEPTTGLDPGMEYNMMRIARELACVGRTVLMTTHAMTNIALCDKLIFVVGGKLAFFGPPAEALRYFRVKRAEELFIIYKDRKPDAWKAQYRSSDLCRKLIPQYSGGAPDSAPLSARPRLRSNGLFESIRQTFILTERCLAIALTDPLNLVLLLALTPAAISLMFLAIKKAWSVALIFALVPLFLGVQNASKEIVKEMAVYRRERMVNLGLVPYMISKLVVLTLIAAVQLASFLYCVQTVRAEAWFSFALFYQILGLAGLVGVTSGLAISAFVRTPDQANTLIPILLISQVIGSGAFQTETRPSKAESMFYNAVSTYWAYDELKRVIGRHDGYSRGDVNARIKQVEETSNTVKQELERLEVERKALSSSLNARVGATRTAVSAPPARYEAPPAPALPADRYSVAGNVAIKRLLEQYQNALKAEMERLKASAEDQAKSVKRSIEDVEVDRTKLKELGRSMSDLAARQRALADELSGLRQTATTSVWYNHLGSDQNRPWIGVLSAIWLALAIILLKLQDFRED